MSRSNREATRPGDPVVGPADPATRRRMIEEQIAGGIQERQRQQAREAPPEDITPPTTQPDTRGARQKAIDDFVESANHGSR